MKFELHERRWVTNTWVGGVYEGVMFKGSQRGKVAHREMRRIEDGIKRDDRDERAKKMEMDEVVWITLPF